MFAHGLILMRGAHVLMTRFTRAGSTYVESHQALAVVVAPVRALDNRASVGFADALGAVSPATRD